jgi:hypothetical protein
MLILRTTAFACVALAFNTAALADIKTGLVAYYKFNGNANDSSGYKNHGTASSEIELTSDKFGKLDSAYQFDGLQDIIEIPNSPSLSFASITVSAWIKPVETPNKSRIYSRIVDKYLFNQKGGFNLVYYEPDSRVFFEFWGTDGQRHNIFTDSQVEVGTWHHVAASYDGITLKIFFDGVPENQLSNINIPINKTSRYLSFGNGYDGFSWWPFSGSIDEVRIYNRAVTSKEIQTIYYSYNPPTIQGTAPWGKAHTVTCKNLTKKTSRKLAATTAFNWDCEAVGLSVKSGDEVEVTIDGTKY